MSLDMPHDRSAAYLEALSKGNLLLSTCQDCQQPYVPARRMCPMCGSITFTWTAASGQGRIWSKVEFHKQYLPDREVPYTVVLVELDEGALVYGLLHGARFDDCAVGTPVSLTQAGPAGQAPVFRLNNQ